MPFVTAKAKEQVMGTAKKLGAALSIKLPLSVLSAIICR
ncbi:hypothetical protein ALT1644_390011 [Alteromonas macleodii]